MKSVIHKFVLEQSRQQIRLVFEEPPTQPPIDESDPDRPSLAQVG